MRCLPYHKYGASGLHRAGHTLCLNSVARALEPAFSVNARQQRNKLLQSSANQPSNMPYFVLAGSSTVESRSDNVNSGIVCVTWSVCLRKAWYAHHVHISLYGKDVLKLNVIRAGWYANSLPVFEDGDRRRRAINTKKEGVLMQRYK